MELICITTREEYDYLRALGYEPLSDRRFEIEHPLRVALQKERFGEGHTPVENERFYRFCWENMQHRCEECMKPLGGYSAVYISHILTRGAHPDMAHDPRNVNMLCFEHHNMWEHATTRGGMRIYSSNQEVIRKLRAEYEGL